MSVILEQAPGTGGGVTEPPLHPCKPKDASSATAVPTPSFSSSRRVKLRIGCISLRCVLRSNGGKGYQVPVGRVTGQLAHRHSGPPLGFWELETATGSYFGNVLPGSRKL